ncbi:MAG: ferric reductase-like transmembrane domain-containing protein [Gammaproteobacteria bacterium]
MAAANKARWQHHTLLAVCSLLIFALTVVLRGAESTADQLSFATAYLCLFFLATALLIGPLQLSRGGHALLNNYLRRDVGIWAAVTGLIHFVLATDISMSQAYMADYVAIDTGNFSAELRMQLFTWGTIAGLVTAVLLILLLALSNDRVLRRVGNKWWKRLQRSAYFAFALTVVHSFAFQALESRRAGLVIVMSLITVAVVVFQLRGAAAYRRFKNQR